MGILDDIQDADGAYFVDTDFGAETITYTPLGADAVTIKAVVFRNPPQQVNGSFTTITVATREGGTPVAHPVDSILQQGGGMWKLRLR
jgi:hypothetical protein